MIDCCVSRCDATDVRTSQDTCCAAYQRYQLLWWMFSLSQIDEQLVVRTSVTDLINAGQYALLFKSNFC